MLSQKNSKTRFAFVCYHCHVSTYYLFLCILNFGKSLVCIQAGPLYLYPISEKYILICTRCWKNTQHPRKHFSMRDPSIRMSAISIQFKSLIRVVDDNSLLISNIFLSFVPTVLCFTQDIWPMFMRVLSWYTFNDNLVTKCGCHRSPTIQFLWQLSFTNLWWFYLLLRMSQHIE
jgi:hypothetical protein